jgi:hypothetical protein
MQTACWFRCVVEINQKPLLPVAVDYVVTNLFTALGWNMWKVAHRIVIPLTGSQFEMHTEQFCALFRFLTLSITT